MPSNNTSPRWVLPLQRHTSQGEHLREIDGLRFIAIMMVMLMHLNIFVVLDASPPLSPNPTETALYKLLDHGDFGVLIFFAISGFILGLPFARHHIKNAPPVRLSKYFLRRLTRLEPPLIINLVILFALMTLVLGRSFKDLWPNLLATCTYLHSAIFSERSIINGVTWSLEVEAQFYICMPLLAQVYRVPSFRLRQCILASAALLLILIDIPWPKASLPRHLPYFLIGLMTVDIWITRWNEAPRRSKNWDLPAFTLWIGLLYLLYLNREAPMPSLSRPALLFATLIVTFKSETASAILRHWLPVTIGGMCYTIYLYHMLFFSSSTRITHKFLTIGSYHMNYLAHFVLLIPFTLVLSSVLFYLFEKPFMKFRTAKSPTPVNTQ